MRSRLLGVLRASIVLIGVVATSANAALINGSIDMGGALAPLDSVGNPTTLTLATGLNFTSSTVTIATGDFATYVSVGSSPTMTGFQFSPSLLPNPVNVWVAGGFTFAMTSVSSIVPANPYVLALLGTGTVTGNGYDPTQGTFVLTAQTANQTTFSWSSSTSAVPVPAAVWLFGSGLLGLLGIARKKAG